MERDRPGDRADAEMEAAEVEAELPDGEPDPARADVGADADNLKARGHPSSRHRGRPSHRGRPRFL